MSARTSAQPWLGIRLLMADERVPGPMSAQPVAPRLRRGRDDDAEIQIHVVSASRLGRLAAGSAMDDRS